MGRYRIVTVHGEGSSLYLVVDFAQPEGEQPAVVCSYRDKAEAEDAAACFNMAGAVIV